MTVFFFFFFSLSRECKGILFAKCGLHVSLIADFTLCVSGSGDDEKRKNVYFGFIVVSFFSLFFPANSASPKIPHQHQLSEFCAQRLLLRNAFSGLSGFLSTTQKLALSSSVKVFKDACFLFFLFFIFFLPLLESMEAWEPVSMAK